MFARLPCMLAAAIWLAAAAAAQEQQAPQSRDTVLLSRPILTFHHYDCPPVDPTALGGSPENAIDDLFFGQAFYNAMYSDQPDVEDEPNKYECRWIRLRGFIDWDETIYSGRLFESVLATYSPDIPAFYFIENFAAGAPPRGDVARRSITLVGQFYDLCAAGERALEAEKASYVKRPGELVSWHLSYPCHEIPAMILSDVRVEKIHDATPQYILGERNRAIMNSLVTATPEQRKEIEPLVRTWAASLRNGIAAFADATLAQYPKMEASDRQKFRTNMESRDSYPSHLLRQPRFMQLNLKKAPVQVFHPENDDAFDTAVGCICLAASCTDRWPLTEEDAETFLGDAACVELQRWNSTVWRW